MRIAIDLDGVIAQLKTADQSYADVKPVAGAADRLRELKSAGHYIIINSARNMATCESNVGRVVKNIGKITLEWLERHGIEYDEIYFGKPNAHLYIDDRAVRFEDWRALSDERLESEARDR
jgi:capsule biosynthesis phosphatase